MSLIHTYTFTGTTLDPDWGVYNTAYSSNPDARVPSLITVSDGALHVTTSGKQGSGLCLCTGSGKPTVPYGRWDVRARAEADADHGFAVLLWPNAENWPVGGELDLAEFPGATRSVLQTTVHYGSTNRQYTAFTSGDFTAWHTYSVIWTPSSVTYLLDDRPVMTVTDPAAIPTGAMHLGLQAGANSSTPSATTATLDVEWVKIYR
jgi:beta-glucanase (GH16 family)